MKQGIKALLNQKPMLFMTEPLKPYIQQYIGARAVFPAVHPWSSHTKYVPEHSIITVITERILNSINPQTSAEWKPLQPTISLTVFMPNLRPFTLYLVYIVYKFISKFSVVNMVAGSITQCTAGLSLLDSNAAKNRSWSSVWQTWQVCVHLQLHWLSV